MPFFSVLMEGSNLCTPSGHGEPPIAGFFASRVIWVADMGTAEDKALRSVRNAWVNGDYATQPTSGQLDLTVSETKPSSFRGWLGASNTGHTFFPAEQVSEAPSTTATD
jgi:hypothetical protein